MNVLISRSVAFLLKNCSVLQHFFQKSTSAVCRHSVRKLKRNELWDFCPGVTRAPSGFRLNMGYALISYRKYPYLLHHELKLLPCYHSPSRTIFIINFKIPSLTGYGYFLVSFMVLVYCSCL